MTTILDIYREGEALQLVYMLGKAAAKLEELPSTIPDDTGVMIVVGGIQDKLNVKELLEKKLESERALAIAEGRISVALLAEMGYTMPPFVYAIDSRICPQCRISVPQIMWDSTAPQCPICEAHNQSPI